MTGPAGKQTPTTRQMSPKNVGLILVAASFLLPSSLSAIQRSSLSVSITNYLWYLRLLPFFYFEIYAINGLVLGIVVFVLSMRSLFALQMMRLYQGRSTGARVYIASLLAMSFEIVPFLGNVVSLFWYPENPYLFSPIPLPLLLLTAIIIVVVFPPDGRERLWIENEPQSRWWISRPSLKASSLATQIQEM